MKFAIIDTTVSYGDVAGTVISIHRTREAAEKVNARLQREIKRLARQSSYLPTIICQVDPVIKRGQPIQDSFILS